MFRRRIRSSAISAGMPQHRYRDAGARHIGDACGQKRRCPGYARVIGDRRPGRGRQRPRCQLPGPRRWRSRRSTSTASRPPPASATSWRIRSSASRRSVSQLPEEGRAALVQREGPLERLAAGLELGDRPLELGEGVVEREVGDRGGGFSRVPSPASSSSGSAQRSMRGAHQHTDDDPDEREAATASPNGMSDLDHVPSARIVHGRGDVAARDPDAQRRPGRRLVRRPERSTRRSRGGRSRSLARAWPTGRARPGRPWPHRGRASLGDAIAGRRGRAAAAASTAVRAARTAPGHSAAGRRPRHRAPGDGGQVDSTTRVARSNSSPTCSRAAASRAAGLTRSRARRSTARSRAAATRRRSVAVARRSAARRRAPAISTRSGTTISAAADGVGARTSAAKSARVTSTS